MTTKTHRALRDFGCTVLILVVANLAALAFSLWLAGCTVIPSQVSSQTIGIVEPSASELMPNTSAAFSCSMTGLNPGFYP